MSQTESFFFPGPAGRVEAVLMTPADEPVAAAVVCHANPLQGGMMHFKVVFRAAKALQAAGSAVLRFNFRGVGLSDGIHDHGNGEQDDVKAALDEMERRFPRERLLLGGFSFGSIMALAVGASDERPAALFALGVPVKLETMVERLPAMSRKNLPRLFVQGQHDVFGSVAEIRAAVATFPEPKELVVIPAADHFFSHQLDPLQAAIHEWAARRPWERP